MINIQQQQKKDVDTLSSHLHVGHILRCTIALLALVDLGVVQLACLWVSVNVLDGVVGPDDHNLSFLCFLLSVSVSFSPQCLCHITII